MGFIARMRWSGWRVRSFLANLGVFEDWYFVFLMMSLLVISCEDLRLNLRTEL